VGDLRIALHPAYSGALEPAHGKGWILVFSVDSILALEKKLYEIGVETRSLHDTPGGVVMDFQDPDGNRLQAMQLGTTIADL